jgi:hypothetical protein
MAGTPAASGGLNAVSRGTGLGNDDHTLAVNAVATLSARTVNETRVQITRSRLEAAPNDLAGPAVNISGVANLGTSTAAPTARAIDLYELADVITHARGAHVAKAGFDVLWNRLDIAFPGAIQGVYTFASLAAFQSGQYVTFQQAFGATSQFQSNPNLGVFLQDEWRARRGLTVNAGLRYDVEWLPAPIHADTDNLSPRLGLAWAPGSGRTVVRASTGLFFDRVPLRATSNALQRDGSRYRTAVLPFGAAGAPVFPAVRPAFPDGLLASVTTIDPDIEAAQGWQSSVQVERQLGSATAVAVGYLRNRTTGIILSRNVNAPTLTAAEAAARGIANLGRPDPRFANVTRYGSLGRAHYDGLTLSARRRFTRALNGRVAYTWSRSKDDAGNAFFFTPQDSNDVAAEWGPSDHDQRHRLVASATAVGLAGFQLSGIFTYGSPLPFNVVTGTDRNSDTTVNDRPAGVSRNSERGFSFASLDLRLGRRFAIGRARAVELIAEGFIVL